MSMDANNFELNIELIISYIIDNILYKERFLDFKF